MGVVSHGQEAIDKDPAIPDQVQNTIISILKQSRRFFIASSLVPDHQRTVAQAVQMEATRQPAICPVRLGR